MSETVIDGIHLSLSGPETLPLSVVLRGSPTYNGPRCFFNVSFKNDSDRTRSLPFDEMRRNIVSIYRNSAGAERVDNRTPPPKAVGTVEALPPGGTKSFQVVFEYPASIAIMKKREALFQFCIKWETKWLRSTSYAPDAYDWNPSFELCREIRIIAD